MIGFAQALIVWAWLEMSYFMGFVTGPCKLACPPDIAGWARFRLALKTSLHHEAAVVALGVSIILLTWDAPNQFGTWTFVTLWSMRWSAVILSSVLWAAMAAPNKSIIDKIPLIERLWAAPSVAATKMWSATAAALRLVRGDGEGRVVILMTDGENLQGVPPGELIEEDPLFCDAEARDFGLCEDSPCTEASNPECGLVGARPVGCGPCGPVPTTSTDLGSLRTRFR